MVRSFGARRFKGVAIGFAAAALVCGGLGGSVAQVGGSLPLQGDEFPSGDGGSSAAVASGTGSHWNVLNWAPGVPAAVPAAFGMNTVDDTGRTVKKVLVSTSSGADVATAAPKNNMSYSDDSAKTFLTTVRDSPASAAGMLRMPDGSLLTIDFKPAWADVAQTRVNLLVRTSKDGGKSWKLRKAPLSSPADEQFGLSYGLRVNGNPLVLADGTLLASGYTVFKGTSKQRSVVLQSTDSGKSWSLRSVVPATAQLGTNELTWSYTSDGRLTAVMRTTDSPEPHIVQSFSDDDGKSWSEAKDLLGPDGVVVHGVSPDMVLQPNGTLLLTTGRPDVRVYISNDGTGKTWDKAITAFANYPSTGSNGRYDGSSGNNSLENVGANTSVLFYDQCMVWGCGAYNQQFGVSAEYVSAVTPGVGKIDVASKLIDGTATVTGNFAGANKRFPEQRPAGAFDGSSTVGAEAVLKASSRKAPQLVLTLDREYSLNKIGLMLGHGELAQTATVSLSEDGTTWTPVITAKNRLDRSMKYTDFATQNARYVKVSGPLGATTTVTELELYSADVDTFENEIPFSVPRGWTDAANAWVTNVPDDPAYSDFGGYHSSTVLRLWDKFTDANAHITRPTPHTGHLYAAMQWGSSDQRALFTFGVNGTAADGSSVPAWNFRLNPGTPATLQAYDGTNWVTAGTFPGPLPSRTYLPLTVDATTDTATVTLGTSSFTTKVRAAQTSDLADLHFSTGDPAQYGGIYYLDDVSVAVDPGSAPQLGAASCYPVQAKAGQPLVVSTTLTNPGDKPATSVSAELHAPQGWTITPRQVPGNLAAGQRAAVSWTVTAPARAPVGSYQLAISATYRSGDAWMSASLPEVPLSLGVVPQNRMTATATTAQPGATYQPSNAIDGNPATFWHSQYTGTKAVPPQSITLALGDTYRVTGLTYLPRQDSSTNGTITAYNVFTSTDGSTFVKVGSGNWAADKTIKTAKFRAGDARFVRLEATAAVADLISAAELNVMGTLK
ncbi:MAG: discoidin domain-containing protein [Nakamurella sp.]